MPTAAGTYLVTAFVGDAVGAIASANTTLEVIALPVGSSSGPSPWIVGGVVATAAGAAVTGVVAVLLAVRRSPRPPD